MVCWWLVVAPRACAAQQRRLCGCRARGVVHGTPECIRWPLLSVSDAPQAALKASSELAGRKAELEGDLQVGGGGLCLGLFLG